MLTTLVEAPVAGESAPAALAVRKRVSMAAERAIVDRRVRPAVKRCLIGPVTVQGPKLA
jgi:hypothetical protein